jgi:hypothetical protein
VPTTTQNTPGRRLTYPKSFGFKPSLTFLALLFFTQVAYAQTYTITVNARPNGTISPSGPVQVPAGGSQRFTIRPTTPGYHISQVLVDGNPVGQGPTGVVTSYTFPNVNANHTIDAIFASGHTLTMQFDQSAYSPNVWLQIQDPLNSLQATYNNGANWLDFTNQGQTTLMSVPVKLADLGPGGLNISFANSAILYVFYDDPTGNDPTAAPAFMISTQRFVPFEVTMLGNPGDYGNLTAINYFTAPLSIRSYDAGNNLLQQAGWISPRSIARQLAAASGNNSNIVVRDAHNKIIRYLGPSNWGSNTNPWPSFIPYTTSIGSQITMIQPSPQQFNFSDQNPVYLIGTNMNATAQPDGSLNMQGSITISLASGAIKKGPYGNPDLPSGGAWTNTTCDMSAAQPDLFNSAIYGSVVNGAVSFTGWDAFQTFCQQTLFNPDYPYQPDPTQPNYNPCLNDYVPGQPLNVYQTVQNTLIGEISTGLLGGFVNSNYQVNGVAIKNMPSYQWWALNPMVAFAAIQPQHPFYDTYSNVVFNGSGNTVYGVPYSDRFQNSSNNPAVYTVQYQTQSGPVSVASWVVGIGAPLPQAFGVTPELMLLLLQ